MGRKQFEQVVAQASREKLKIYTRDVTTNLAAATGEEILIYSNPGTIAEVVGMRLYNVAPVGAASGNHYIYLGYKTGVSNNIDLMLISSVFGTGIQFVNSYVSMGTGTPTDIGAQGDIVRKIRFDDVTPLRIFYDNQTNVGTGTARRFIFITYIEREVRA
jgi:hypothetical protein